MQREDGRGSRWWSQWFAAVVKQPGANQLREGEGGEKESKQIAPGKEKKEEKGAFLHY